MHTSEGIVLNSIKYGESSLILRVLTPDRGLRSFLVSGVRKSKSGVGAALVQPLAVAQWVYYDKPDGLERVKEVKAAVHYTRLYSDVPRTTAALLLIELTAHCHHEPAPNPDVYPLLRQSLLFMDENPDCTHIPVWFAVRLSQVLGFAPEAPEAPQPCFDLRESSFSSYPPAHSHFLYTDETALLGQLLCVVHPGNLDPCISVEVAFRLLAKWIQYYQYHIAQFGQLNAWATYRQFLQR
jgi:DNA repair protein RecO (recombination protein O)